MRTSDTCRKEARSVAGVTGCEALRGGFTLLELVVVLALLGLVTAIALPNFERLYAGVTRTSERDYVLDQVAALGREAMLNGRAYVVFGDTAPPELAESARYADYETYVVDVPDGWRLELDGPLVVLANGVCLGGALTLSHPEEAGVRVELAPPYCRIDADA